ncbi:MAG: DUF3293 domain-containing protein [Candidatus Nitrotoga sp.]
MNLQEVLLISDSVISPETIQAYRETDYRVDRERSLVLRINEFNESLATLYKINRVNCCAFITACNPFGQAIDETANAHLQEKLASEIKNRGLIYFKGSGKNIIGDWPSEPSYLVLGISLEASKSLGIKYDQNAIVWCGSDAVPHLVLLR